jgi:soluble lytic murein transglycosylase
MIKAWGCLFGTVLALSASATLARPPKAVHSKAVHAKATHSKPGHSTKHRRGLARAAVVTAAVAPAIASATTASAAYPPVPAPAALPASTLAPAAAQADRDFLIARDAFKAGDSIKLDRAAASLDGYVLAPYVRYWQLRLRIDEADPVAVRSFLAMHRDSLLADRMRNDWLKALGKKGTWDLFAQEYQLAQDEDTELVCYGLQQRLAREPAVVMAEAKRIWATGADTPDSCEPLFGAMLDKGVLNDRDLWLRFELAAEAGNFSLAQRLNGRVPNGHQIAPKDLDRANQDPERVLTKIEFHGASVAGRELALYALQRALSRAGRERLDAVGDAWKKARGQLPRRYAEAGNAAIGYAFARRLAPDALAWFREAGAAPLNDAQLAWKARAALREQAWDDVLSAIAAMSSAQQQDPAWRYWKARGLAAKGKPAEARETLEYLAQDVSFYGLLAAEEAGITDFPKSEPVVPTPSELADLDSLPSLQRMMKFYQLDLRSEALREWIWTIRNFDDRQRLVAAQYALSKGLFDRAINTADTTVLRHDFALRYLTPYRDALMGAAHQTGVDQALVFGLVRQESRFRADAVSSAGAVGLMQLMPPTAKWVAKQLGQNDYRPSQIGDVATNARFGTYYFKYWLDKFDNLPVLAVAGYNAGPGRAQAWRAKRPLEGAIYAETIPFNETRDYVKRVFANAIAYGRQFGTPVSLKQMLAVIPPKGGRMDEIAAAGQVETEK